MNNAKTTVEKRIYSWKFTGLFIVLQFIVPFVTKNFSFEHIGTIIGKTLSHALTFKIVDWYPYIQVVGLLAFIFLIICRKRNTRWFPAYVAICYLLYTVIQNIAITDQFGISIVTSNFIGMLAVSASWWYDFKTQQTDYSFQNFNKNTGWLLIIALFCLWWPISMKTAAPDFNPLYLFTNGSTAAFCPMTPIILIILLFCEPTVNLVTYRVTSLVGIMIGFWNIMSFMIPGMQYVALYHLPLFILSIVGFMRSGRLYRRWKESLL